MCLIEKPDWSISYNMGFGNTVLGNENNVLLYVLFHKEVVCINVFTMSYYMKIVTTYDHNNQFYHFPQLKKLKHNFIPLSQ